MVVTYRGRLEELSREVGDAKPYLDRAFRDIFGSYKAQELANSAQRLLVPESFLDLQELRRLAGREFPENSPNKFSAAYRDIQMPDQDGIVPRQTVISFPSIYCSQIGTPEDSTTLKSYIHEFCHFAYYALQPVCIGLLFYLNRVNPGNPDEFADYIIGLIEQDLSPEKQQECLRNAVFSYSARNVYEKATQILANRVLSSIGQGQRLEWRDQPKKFYRIEYGNDVLVLPSIIEGDPFLGTPDYTVVNGMVDWTRFIGPQEGNKSARNPYIEGMFGSIRRNVTEVKVPVTEFGRAVEKQEKRIADAEAKKARKLERRLKKKK